MNDGPARPGERPAADVLIRLLSEAARKAASDLLLIAGAPAAVYALGQWSHLTDDPLAADDIAKALESILTDDQRARLREQRDLDFAFRLVIPRAEASNGRPPRQKPPPLHAVARYRVNMHYQQGTLAAAFRAIPAQVPPFNSLRLPEQVLGFADFPNGLVLITGCTGQGKSTTLAAIVDHMNRTRAAHLITIEDPIEFTFTHGTCLIEQRQIGDDSPSFASALRHILRQRPDVILIGEMRDLETIATALTAAETGHLVLASLHTSSTAQTLARIVDVFPPAQQPQVQTQLAASLRAILCQTLVRDNVNETLLPATEILLATSGVRRAIRENETHLIYAMLETGKKCGMHTLEQCLAALVKAGRVQPEEALAAAVEPSRLARLIGAAPKTSSFGTGVFSVNDFEVCMAEKQPPTTGA
jgi:twitching motility protein PilT